MKRYILISIGGFLGAISRFSAANFIKFGLNIGGIPLNILIINITGSFIIAFILSLTFKSFITDPDIKAGITTGFLGAYTTFSTLCKEASYLLTHREFLAFSAYIFLSVTLGLAFASFGSKVGELTSIYFAKKPMEGDGK